MASFVCFPIACLAYSSVFVFFRLWNPVLHPGCPDLESLVKSVSKTSLKACGLFWLQLFSLSWMNLQAPCSSCRTAFHRVSYLASVYGSFCFWGAPSVNQYLEFGVIRVPFVIAFCNYVTSLREGNWQHQSASCRPSHGTWIEIFFAEFGVFFWLILGLVSIPSISLVLWALEFSWFWSSNSNAVSGQFLVLRLKAVTVLSVLKIRDLRSVLKCGSCHCRGLHQFLLSCGYLCNML